MCGIFGIFVKKDTTYSLRLIKKLFKELALISESRGKESSGIAIRDQLQKEIHVIRSAMPISELLKESEYKNDILTRLDANYQKAPLAIIGHSRLVTDGSQLKGYNNQPVVKDGIVAIHNGIIVNVDELWKNHPNLTRKYEIDTEIMLSLIHEYNSNSDLSTSISKMMEEIFGTVSTVMLFEDQNIAALASNNGSLYYLTDNHDILIFASEKYMLETLKKKNVSWNLQKEFIIKQIKEIASFIINLKSFSLNKLAAIDNQEKKLKPIRYKLTIQDITTEKEQIDSLVDTNLINSRPEAISERKMLQNNIKAIMKMKRCSKCILPETFPFIEFDENGVCNYCNNYYTKNTLKSIKTLLKIVEPFRNMNGDPDVLIPYSGGRDSTFTLHYLKTFLKMNPIAFTYDWGMVTDLARRNIARICSKLQIENIIVSADIHKKRENIKRNISAWLKGPNLGTIPLFMTGDKYVFYYCNKVKEQTGIRLNIWGTNYLEDTDFKIGFMGLRPEFKYTKNNRISFSKFNQIRLFRFLLRNIINNYSYLNSSIPDTIGSYIVRFIFPRKDYYHFFDYYRWDENEIVKTIRKKYNWEISKDTESTWRIGDGTASFYNYIYYTTAGFTESDTFRSNQIREKMITRDKALKLVEIENEPRYESIKWYLDIIGIDFEKTIDVINSIPKLYRI